MRKKVLRAMRDAGAVQLDDGTPTWRGTPLYVDVRANGMAAVEVHDTGRNGRSSAELLAANATAGWSWVVRGDGKAVRRVVLGPREWDRADRLVRELDAITHQKNPGREAPCCRPLFPLLDPGDSGALDRSMCAALASLLLRRDVCAWDRSRYLAAGDTWDQLADLHVAGEDEPGIAERVAADAPLILAVSRDPDAAREALRLWGEDPDNEHPPRTR